MGKRSPGAPSFLDKRRPSRPNGPKKGHFYFVETRAYFHSCNNFVRAVRLRLFANHCAALCPSVSLLVRSRGPRLRYGKTKMKTPNGEHPNI
jgi:hypothetical protein